MYNEKNLYWKGRRLMFKSLIIQSKPDMVMGIQPSEQDPAMFWVQWPDGILSADRYNIERAKEHCVALALAELNKNEVNSEI